MMRRSRGPPRLNIALRSIFSDAAQLVLLAFFYLLAVLNRRNVPVHMRYMIAVALIVAPAGIARVLGYWFDVPRYESGLASNAVLDAVLIALILFDRRNHLNYRPYLLVLPLFVLSHAAFALLARPVAPIVSSRAGIVTSRPAGTGEACAHFAPKSPARPRLISPGHWRNGTARGETSTRAMPWRWLKPISRAVDGDRSTIRPST